MSELNEILFGQVFVLRYTSININLCKLLSNYYLIDV